MGDFTGRLALFKPNLLDFVSILDDISNNYDKLDDPVAGALLLNYPGQILVQPVVFPSTQFAAPVAVTPDAAATTGSALATIATSNHQHGISTYAATPAAWVQGGNAGTAGTAPARGNHQHPVTVSTATPVAGAIAGSSGTTDGSHLPSADDHVHPLAVAPAYAALLATPATITTVEIVVLNYQFAANQLAAGVTIGVKMAGTISATSAGSLTARLRLGTAGTTADAQVFSTGAVGTVTTAVGFFLDGLVQIRSAGAGGTALGNGHLNVGAATLPSAQTATTAVNTTVANFLDLTLVGAGTAPSITVTNASIHVMRG